jgi:uncharacterized protein YeaO (DUF488 family)
MMDIKTKRIYEGFNKENSTRILIDRLWPRGIKKESARIDEWIKDIAPSDALRRWFDHDPDKWEGFKKKYFDELNDKKDIIKDLLNKTQNNITLVYSAKDEKHNNAIALKEYLENYLKIR